jgi:hypothetical protein
LATTELFVLQSCQAVSSFSNRQKGAQRFAAEEKMVSVSHLKGKMPSPFKNAKLKLQIFM